MDKLIHIKSLQNANNEHEMYPGMNINLDKIKEWTRHMLNVSMYNGQKKLNENDLWL